MAAPLTIIIPTLNCADRLGPCLAAVFEGVSNGLVARVVFSDGGSEDGILDVTEDTGATLINGPPGRGGQLARGAEAAASEWLMFLHADSVLPPDWPAVVRGHMQNSDRAAVFRLRFDHKGPMARIVAGWANLRTRVFGLPYGDQGLLMPAGLYARSGGFTDLPLMEDVEILRRLPARPVMLDAVLTTSAARYQAEGWLRRGARNLTLLARYRLGADPQALYDRYYGPSKPR